MDKARIRATDQEISAGTYQKEAHGEVVCYSCRCSVVGVQASIRIRDGEVIPIRPFFRLPQNAQSSGQGHAANCSYNLPNLVTKYVAKSKEIKLVDPRAVPLLGRKHGVIIFRLHILTEAFRWLRRARYAALSDEPTPRKPGYGNRFVKTDTLLIPYLKSAKAVNSFVAAVQERPDLKDLIQIVYGPYVLDWSDYFFEVDEYCDLLRRLLDNTIEQTPIALVVDIIAGQPLLRTKYGVWQIRGHASGCELVDPRFYVRPVLYVGSEPLAKRILQAGTLLVCGMPKSERTLYQPNNPNLLPRVDIKIEVYSPTQVCAYNSTRSLKAGP